MPEDKLPIPKFAAKIKAKYPEYRDVNDTLLVQRIVEKYPEYKDSVDLSGIEEPVKKKVTGAGLSLGSKVGGLELQSIGGQAKIESGIAAGAEQGVPESKMIGGGALKVQGIPTKEQSKQNIVNKAFGRLESLSGGYKDFEDIYNYSPKEFDNLASKIAPEVKKEEINKFYTSEAARKDAYINRVLQNYKTKKTELQLESARQERPVVDENVSLALNFLSGKTGKTYQIPQTEEQVREILNDTEKVKEIFRLQSEQNVSSVKDVLELDKQWNELNEAERQLKDRLRPVIGRIAFEKLSQQNPNVSSREIGAEVLRVLDPQMYAIYKNSGGDKPSSYTVGVQRQTPVMADQLNRQMVEVGNQIKRLYGNEFAIEEADVEEQAANRKYTFDKQNQVKQKIAAILHERGLSPSKATEKLKDEVANKYLSDEDKATWFENNKIYNNVDLPDTGFGYSLKKAYQNTVQDAVSTVFGGLIPNRKQELSREILGDYSGATAELGEDPAQKQRLQFLRDKEQSAPLTEKEKLEKEDLEGYTGIRTKMEKIWDMAGAGTGQILGLGSISAFTGGLSSARAGLGALKSLIAPSGGNTAVSAAAYLMSHEQNAKESLRIFPDEKDEFKRFLNTEMTTAIDVLVERIFPEEQFLNGVGKKEVSALIANLTQKNLSRQINDNTFKQLAKRIIGGSKRLLATPLQETAEEELALVLKDTLKKTINPDYEKESIGIKELVETGEAAFWGSIFLGAPKMLFGGGANNVPLTALWDAASTEDGYLTTKMTIERLKSEGELTEQEAAERLRNLEIGRKEFENNPILSGDMGGLSESQKQNYFARLLNEKILEENAAATTDTNLQKQYETEIKESQKIREGIYKQEIKVTPENEEVKIDQDRDLMDEGVEDEFLAELQSKAGKGTQNQDLRFFIDQAANAPNQFVDTYGEEATKKLLSMATTEQLEKSMKDWARLNPDSPAVALIDEELGRREELTKPETAEKKEEEIESKIKDALAEIYRIDRTALVEGFAEFASQSQALRDAGGLNYHAHGMGKSTIASAFKDLFTLFKNGIDKSRGGGRLHTAPLGSTGMETAGATASGAYADGPFILISREANLTDINQVEAILVNDGLISIKPDLLNLLRERFPNLTIETYSNSSKAVTELNNKTKQQETKQNIPERGQATKKILTSEQTTQDANDIITGKKVFERFSPQEQRGFAEGGTSHVEASLLLAADEGTGGKDNATPEAQENRIEQYAKDKGIWDDNTTETLTQKYGEPIAAGEEAVIWGDEKKGTVIKTQDTFQYENLQQKLDGITLHNAYFPEAAIKVIGFGRNANGEFQVIVEQPHIQGEKLTPEEIKTYLESVGFKEDENGNFSNGEVIIEDVHTGNAIKDKEGNIIVIDPIMRLNTEAQGYGGKRKTLNKISPTEQPQSGITKQQIKEETKTAIPEPAEKKVEEGSGVGGDVEATAKKIVGESAFDKLKKEGYTIEKGKFDRDAYADFFGVGESVQADEFANAGLRLVKPSEKIKVYRGKGKNVGEGENEGITWVAEDKKVAENYSGDGKVEEVEVSKPKNPFPNPTDTIYVKGSDVGNKLRLVRDRLFKEGKLTKEQALKASKAIDDFVSAAGEESELYSTKTNKKGVSPKYVKALQALGFDGIVQKESYNSGSPFTATKTGNETNTYGIFKDQSPSSTTPSKEQPKAETPTQETKPVSEPTTPPTTQAKELADKVRKLKIDLGKLSGGGLQSNPLGLPVAVWNGAMDIIAKTIETGGNIADAIKRGLNYIQKNHRGQWNKKQFNDEVMKELGVRGITVNGEDLVVKDVDKEFAETINGFYSDLEQTILDVSPTDKGTPQAWLKKIGTGDEAKWTGVTDWLNSLPKDQKLTRKEILDWLKDNRIQVVEVVKGEVSNFTKEDIADVKINQHGAGNWVVKTKKDGTVEFPLDKADDKAEAIEYALEQLNYDNKSKRESKPKFQQYQIEGEKENYKEVLVTMPSNNETQTSLDAKLKEKGYVMTSDGKIYPRTIAGYADINNSPDGVSFDKLPNDVQKVANKLKGTIGGKDFKSSHFDEPNILVHLRMNTRVDAEGKKVLFLEEVQSDWGQQGKKSGFANTEQISKLRDEETKLRDSVKKNKGEITADTPDDVYNKIRNENKLLEEQIYAIQTKITDLQSKSTPSAPFVTDTNAWTKLGLKVALKEAVKQGADKVAWTTGEQQNERYDLSKQVNKIVVQKQEDGRYRVAAWKDSPTAVSDQIVNSNEVEGIVGKEIADKALNQGQSVFKGNDLKVGGKGMKGFYGSPSEGKLGIVGEVAKSLFKQEPKTTEIETKSLSAGSVVITTEDVKKYSKLGYTFYDNGNQISKQKAYELIERGDRNLEARNEIPSTQHSIIITPELKAEVEGGLPLFKDIKGRGKEIADLLRKGKIKMGGLQSNIAGIPIAIYNAAIETIALALEGGATLTQAIQKAINKHKLNQQKGFNQKEFISKLEDATGEKFTDDQQEPPPPQTPKQEPKEVGIKHKETEAIRQRYGLPEYERVEGKTNAELEAEADRLISEGYDIEKLIKKIEDGTPPTGVENYILTKYIGNLEAKFAKDKSDETLKELKRLLDATDRIGSLQSEAFRTRKAMSPADDSLASFFIKEMDSLGVDELTEEQKVKIEAEFNEIKETNDALQKKIVELEAKVAEAQAAAAISNQSRRVAKGRKTKQQFQEERKKIVGNIREKLRKAKGDTQATVVPYLKELILISPDVAQLVKNLVEEGVTNLADVVDNIHDYLRDEIDGIQKKDVIDLIAGVYEPQKPTKGQLLAQWRDLKEEAKLLNKYEALMAGEVPQKESKKIERNRQITELRKKIKESDVTKLANRKAQIKANIQKIEEQINKGDFSKPEKKKPIKLDKEGLQLRDKLIKLKQQRDARILLNQRLSETKNQRALRLFTEVLNIPRTLMTIGDFSGLLRQGIFGISHPSIMVNASKQMFKAAFSQKEYDRWFADLKEDPRYYAMKESKLSISDSLSHDLSEREEVFMSTLAEKIPIVGQTLRVGGKKVVPGLNIVKGSERSYTALLNKMRVDLFNYFADRMEARGLTVENAPKQYKAMAEYINNSTGRSDFGKHLNRIAPILNATFFSPRLIASRVNMLTYFAQPRFWRTLPKEARIDYFRSWASLLSLGLVVLGLAKAGGADVEDDPRSSDFGKIKDGDTRWDIWGGAQPYVRVFAQVFSGQRKSTNNEELYKLTGDDAFGQTRAGVVSNFFRGKLAPVPASLVDVLSGRTTTGDKIVYEFEADGVKEVAIDNYIAERLLPMTITGTREAIQERGLSALLSVGIPSTFGVGTQTYGKPIKEVRDEVDYEGRKVKLTTQQYKEYRDLANKYIDYYVGKLKSLKEFNEISDRDEKFGLERTVKNAAVKKAESEIIEKYERTFPQKTVQEERSEEEKEQRKSVIIEKTIE